MSLSTLPTITRLVSHAAASGLFTSVNGHEPKNGPEAGLTAAVWVDSIKPYRARSGLASTSAVVIYMMRLYTNMIAEPQDAIDPGLTAAVDTIMTALTGDYSLGGTVSNLDLLGESGSQLEAKAGYVELSGTVYRVFDITIPAVVNDAWAQAS